MVNVVKSVCGHVVYDEAAHKRIDTVEDTVREQVQQLNTFRYDTEQAIGEMQANVSDQLQDLNRQTQNALSEVNSAVSEMENDVSETLQTTQSVMNGRLAALQESIDTQMDEKQAEVNQTVTNMQNNVAAQIANMEQRIPSIDGGTTFEIQMGTVDSVGTSGKTITFNHPFSAVPVVVACGGSQTCSVQVSAITTDNFIVESATSGNTGVQWIAIGIK